MTPPTVPRIALMIRVDLSTVGPGARLAKPIYNDRGAIWLKAGTELSERYLTILRGRGIGAVFVEEDGTHDVMVREAITEESRGQATAAVGDVVTDLAPGVEGVRQHGLAELVGWLNSGEGRRTLRDSMAPRSIQSAAQRLVS